MLSALRHKLAYGSDHWNTVQRSPTEARSFQVWAALATRPRLYRTVMRVARLFQRFYVQQGKISKIPGPAASWCSTRDLQPLARRNFAEIWKQKYEGTDAQAIRPASKVKK